MSFINQEVLKAFVEQDSYLITENIPAGLDEAICQADDTINIYTGIEVPASPSTDFSICMRCFCFFVAIFSISGYIAEKFTSIASHCFD